MKIFYDIDTQNDFMNKDGALYVPDAELIKPNLKLLTQYAQSTGKRLVGSVDIHFGTEEYKEREGELQRWGGPFPDHCMNGEEGQKKISETKMTKYEETGHWSDRFADDLSEPIYLENVTSLTYSKALKVANIFHDAVSQSLDNRMPVYFEKQSYDVFTNPAFKEFLSEIGVNEAVVYGVATDYCVKAAVLGMQERNIQTYVVEDAIKGVNEETTQQALEEMKQAGAKFVTTKQVLEDLI